MKKAKLVIVRPCVIYLVFILFDYLECQYYNVFQCLYVNNVIEFASIFICISSDDFITYMG